MLHCKSYCCGPPRSCLYTSLRTWTVPRLWKGSFRTPRLRVAVGSAAPAASTTRLVSSALCLLRLPAAWRTRCFLRLLFCWHTSLFIFHHAKLEDVRERACGRDERCSERDGFAQQRGVDVSRHAWITTNNVPLFCRVSPPGGAFSGNIRGRVPEPAFLFKWSGRARAGQAHGWPFYSLDNRAAALGRGACRPGDAFTRALPGCPALAHYYAPCRYRCLAARCHRCCSTVVCILLYFTQFAACGAMVRYGACADLRLLAQAPPATPSFLTPFLLSGTLVPVNRFVTWMGCCRAFLHAFPLIPGSKATAHIHCWTLSASLAHALRTAPVSAASHTTRTCYARWRDYMHGLRGLGDFLP